MASYGGPGGGIYYPPPPMSIHQQYGENYGVPPQPQRGTSEIVYYDYDYSSAHNSSQQPRQPVQEDHRVNNEHHPPGPGYGYNNQPTANFPEGQVSSHPQMYHSHHPAPEYYHAADRSDPSHQGLYHQMQAPPPGPPPVVGNAYHQMIPQRAAPSEYAEHTNNGNLGRNTHEAYAPPPADPRNQLQKTILNSFGPNGPGPQERTQEFASGNNFKPSSTSGNYSSGSLTESRAESRMTAAQDSVYLNRPATASENVRYTLEARPEARPSTAQQDGMYYKSISAESRAPRLEDVYYNKIGDKQGLSGISANHKIYSDSQNTSGLMRSGDPGGNNHKEDEKIKVFMGIVTQIQDSFGMIGDDVFFQKSSVKGPCPKLVDRVLVEAESVEAMPFKWNSKRVQIVNKDLEINNHGSSQKAEESAFTRRPAPPPPSISAISGVLKTSQSLPSVGQLKSILKTSNSYARNPPPPPVISKNSSDHARNFPTRSLPNMEKYRPDTPEPVDFTSKPFFNEPSVFIQKTVPGGTQRSVIDYSNSVAGAYQLFSHNVGRNAPSVTDHMQDQFITSMRPANNFEPYRQEVLENNTPYRRISSETSKRSKSPPMKRHSRSPPSNRRSGPLLSRRHSRSPVSRSRSSPLSRRHSRSPTSRGHSRSPLPFRNSRSPTSRRHSRSPLPFRNSRSPVSRRRSSRSPLPRRHSRSPLRRRHSRSPLSKRHSRSPLPRRHSRSPLSKRSSRSPLSRRRSKSPEPRSRKSDVLKRIAPPEVDKKRIAPPEKRIAPPEVNIRTSSNSVQKVETNFAASKNSEGASKISVLNPAAAPKSSQSLRQPLLPAPISFPIHPGTATFLPNPVYNNRPPSLYSVPTVLPNPLHNASRSGLNNAGLSRTEQPLPPGVSETPLPKVTSTQPPPPGTDTISLKSKSKPVAAKVTAKVVNEVSKQQLVVNPMKKVGVNAPVSAPAPQIANAIQNVPGKSVSAAVINSTTNTISGTSSKAKAKLKTEQAPAYVVKYEKPEPPAGSNSKLPGTEKKPVIDTKELSASVDKALSELRKKFETEKSSTAGKKETPDVKPVQNNKADGTSKERKVSTKSLAEIEIIASDSDNEDLVDTQHKQFLEEEQRLVQKEDWDAVDKLRENEDQRLRFKEESRLRDLRSKESKLIRNGAPLDEIDKFRKTHGTFEHRWAEEQRLVKIREEEENRQRDFEPKPKPRSGEEDTTRWTRRMLLEKEKEKRREEYRQRMKMQERQARGRERRSPPVKSANNSSRSSLENRPRIRRRSRSLVYRHRKSRSGSAHRSRRSRSGSGHRSRRSGSGSGHRNRHSRSPGRGRRASESPPRHPSQRSRRVSYEDYRRSRINRSSRSLSRELEYEEFVERQVIVVNSSDQEDGYVEDEELALARAMEMVRRKQQELDMRDREIDALMDNSLRPSSSHEKRDYDKSYRDRDHSREDRIKRY